MANGTTSGSETYTSDGSGSFALYAAQVEIGLAATEVIESGATTGKAGLLENTPRLDYSGGASCPSLLLEPSRTNLAISSELLDNTFYSNINSSVTNNNATSPEGVQNAALLKNTYDDNQASYIRDLSVGMAPSTTYTATIYAKYVNCQYIFVRNLGVGGAPEVYFDIQNGVVGLEETGLTGDIEPIGNGWYRCIATGTTPSTITNNYIDIGLANEDDGNRESNLNQSAHLYGFQIEEASYATSYIPTYGVSQTRALDAMNEQLSGLTSLEQGTFFLDFDRGLTNATARDGNTDGFFYRSGSSFPATNAIEIATDADGKVRLAIRINGFQQLYANDTLSRYKMLVKWSGTSVKAYVNGVLAYDNPTRWTTTLPLEYIGYNASFRKSVNQVLTFPSALSDVECIALTTI